MKQLDVVVSPPAFVLEANITSNVFAQTAVCVTMSRLVHCTFGMVRWNFTCKALNFGSKITPHFHLCEYL